MLNETHKEMEATLTFPERMQAEKFATSWGRRSKTGHTIGSGLVDVSVTIYGVSENDKTWIDDYILNLNNSFKKATS